MLALAGAAFLAQTTGVIGGTRTVGRASQIILLVLPILVALVGVLDKNGAATMGL